MRRSGFGLGARRSLGLFEKPLGGFAAGRAVLAPGLVLASPLILAGPRLWTPPGVALAVATRLDAIARSQGNLQLDDFIPDRVGTLVIRNSQQFPEAAAKGGSRSVDR